MKTLEFYRIPMYLPSIPKASSKHYIDCFTQTELKYALFRKQDLFKVFKVRFCQNNSIQSCQRDVQNHVGPFKLFQFSRHCKDTKYVLNQLKLQRSSLFVLQIWKLFGAHRRKLRQKTCNFPNDKARFSQIDQSHVSYCENRYLVHFLTCNSSQSILYMDRNHKK